MHFTVDYHLHYKCERNNVPFLKTKKLILVTFRVRLLCSFLHFKPNSLQLVITRLFMLTASNHPAKAWDTLLAYSLPLFYSPFAMWIVEQVLSWATRRQIPIQILDNLPTQFNPPDSFAPTIWPLLPNGYYLLSLGSHYVQLVYLWFQGLILDPKVLLCSCITHFHQIVLHLSQIKRNNLITLSKKEQFLTAS